MTTTCLEMFLICDDGDSATVVPYAPEFIDPSVKAEHYLVFGDRPLLAFPYTQRIADVKEWQRQKEAEGFFFEPIEG
jgi:hypothetical protein